MIFMAKKKNTEGRNMRSIKSSLINYLREHTPGTEIVYKRVATALGVHEHAERELLLEAFREMMESGQLEETPAGNYRHPINSQFVEGKVDMTKNGAAFIIVDGLDEDVFVGSAKMKNALHGDLVKVLLYARKTGKRPEGEIVDILQRSKMEFTGILQVHEKFAFLVADNKRMVNDIFIPLPWLNGAKNGDKVLAKITEWPEGAKSPFGKVVQIFGQPGEHFAEMNAIIAEFGLPTSFPSEIEREADAIPENITQQEIDKRRDFRGIPTFTIDPIDAKDFDDALSIRPLEKGLWEVGVHIADVSHYLKEGTKLDIEALNRATSVYLVDRVIPMLPEKLSNFLCSLRPNEDKLCFSVVVVLDEKAEIQKEWFGRTIINSQKRFSYEEAQEVLESHQGTFATELLTLNKLAYKLREKKFAEGAISFETEEVKFELDDEGKPLRVMKKIRKDAHKLIEDFMLLANRKVAEFIFKKDKQTHNSPFVYRVHDRPNEEKLTNLAKVAGAFGYVIDTKNDRVIAQSINRLLAKSEGRPEQNMLQSLAIRSMAKAFYTTKKSSHYGLAFDYYTHFTSPIRRYPDVIAHRLLAHYILGKKGVDQEEIENQCRHSSEREVKASEAERASIKYKQVEYMLDKVGEHFQGIISGVTEWGIYVEILENKCEGMVRMSELRDDYYIYDEERYLIRGHNSGKVYQLGDIVWVLIKNANLQQRTIDMEFEDPNDPKEKIVRTKGQMPRPEFPDNPNQGKKKPKMQGPQSRAKEKASGGNSLGDKVKVAGSGLGSSDSQKKRRLNRGRRK